MKKTKIEAFQIIIREVTHQLTYPNRPCGDSNKTIMKMLKILGLTQDEIDQIVKGWG